MLTRQRHFLLLEPYYGGSHQRFLTQLQAHLPAKFMLLHLPARKWKMRMQLAAPWMAERIIALVNDGHHFDAIFTSSFIDVAVVRSMLAQAGIHLPIGVYFHENQFAYPSRPGDTARYQFTAINFTSALCADRVAFNSEYNRSTFLAGVQRYLKKAADISLDYLCDGLEKKTTVLWPGMDFSSLDAAGLTEKAAGPVIVWNHRWEHDKNPVAFFDALSILSEQGIDFQLIVLGESFRKSSEIFTRAQVQLKPHILHFGYAPDRADYHRLLHQGSIAVSTALHEFFGMAVLEAVRAGCIPLVPDRLAYREIFPSAFRYRRDQFLDQLLALINRNERLSPDQAHSLTAPYSWEVMAPAFDQWLEELAMSSSALSTGMLRKKEILSR